MITLRTLNELYMKCVYKNSALVTSELIEQIYKEIREEERKLRISMYSYGMTWFVIGLVVGFGFSTYMIGAK